MCIRDSVSPPAEADYPEADFAVWEDVQHDNLTLTLAAILKGTGLCGFQLIGLPAPMPPTSPPPPFPPLPPTPDGPPGTCWWLQLTSTNPGCGTGAWFRDGWGENPSNLSPSSAEDRNVCLNDRRTNYATYCGSPLHHLSLIHI